MESLLFWHWWLIACGLFICEMLLPGVFCMWLGFAAIVTGLAAWLMPNLSWSFELILFAVLSVCSVLLWWKIKPFKTTAVNGLNQRGVQHIGEIYTLVTPIIDGIGKVKVQDSEWRVMGADLPLGAKVRVLSVEGNTLKVEAV